MAELITVQCAIWHNSIKLDEFLKIVKRAPKTSWSIGDINPRNGLLMDRTYCRFEFENVSKARFKEGLILLEQFFPVREVPNFLDGTGKISIYFLMSKKSPMLHINKEILNKVIYLDADIVVI